MTKMWKGCRCPQVSQRGGGGVYYSPPPLGRTRPPGKRSLRGNQKGRTWSHRYGLVSFCCLSSCHPNSLADKPNMKDRCLPSCWWCFRVETILSTSESRLRKFLREDTLGHFHHRASNRQFAWDGTLTQIAFLWVVIFSERPAAAVRSTFTSLPSRRAAQPLHSCYLERENSWGLVCCGCCLLHPRVLINSPGPLLAGHQ